MYGIYAHIWGILMVNVTIYIAYMDPMGNNIRLDLVRFNVCAQGFFSRRWHHCSHAKAWNSKWNMWLMSEIGPEAYQELQLCTEPTVVQP
jgi:hypothetical protein